MKDFGTPRAEIDEAALMTLEIVTQFGQPPDGIDLLSTIDGVRFAQVWADATMTSTQGQTMRVVGLAELRANKAATGRSKDAEDVRP
jgi:glutamine cyclotransferase